LTPKGIALAENRHDDALQLMRAAADAEEASDKHPVTPGNVVPSRELLGDMLLCNEAASTGARRVRTVAQARSEPPSWHLWSRARLQTAGNKAAARDYYAKLQKLTAERDSDRPEFAHAQAYLAAR
jgi:hypothetical protein